MVYTRIIWRPEMEILLTSSDQSIWINQSINTHRRLHQIWRHCSFSVSEPSPPVCYIVVWCTTYVTWFGNFFIQHFSVCPVWYIFDNTPSHGNSIFDMWIYGTLVQNGIFSSIMNFSKILCMKMWFFANTPQAENSLSGFLDTPGVCQHTLLYSHWYNMTY